MQKLKTSQAAYKKIARIKVFLFLVFLICLMTLEKNQKIIIIFSFLCQENLTFWIMSPNIIKCFIWKKICFTYSFVKDQFYWIVKGHHQYFIKLKKSYAIYDVWGAIRDVWCSRLDFLQDLDSIDLGETKNTPSG